jgi:hypothetical protein
LLHGKGSLLHHPDWGFPAVVGQSVADVQISTMISSLQGIFNGDNTFTGVKGINVEEMGNVLLLTATVGIASSAGNLLPISVVVNKS